MRRFRETYIRAAILVLERIFQPLLSVEINVFVVGKYVLFKWSFFVLDSTSNKLHKLPSNAKAMA